jgi:type IV secretion system protein VirB5
MTIKRRLIATVTAAALLFGMVPPRPAKAIDLVFDPAAVAQLVHEVENGVQQLNQLLKIYTNAVQQLNQLIAFYNLFAHVTNAAQLAAVLNSAALMAPMLVSDAVTLERLFSGYGLSTGLASQVQGILLQTRYYQPANTDFFGSHLNMQAQATAGQIAAAQDAYNSSLERVVAMKQLQSSIGTADPKLTADITARSTLESGVAIAQTNQLLAAMALQQAQRDAAQQQSEQAFRYSVDVMRAQAQSAAGYAFGGDVNLVNTSTTLLPGAVGIPGLTTGIGTIGGIGGVGGLSSIGTVLNAGAALGNGVVSLGNGLVSLANGTSPISSLLGGISTGGSSSATLNDADLPTPPIPPAGDAAGTTTTSSTGTINAGDLSGTTTATALPPSNANFSCTTATGADCTPQEEATTVSDTGGCSEISGSVGQSSCGLTFTDEANGGVFDPTQPISAVTSDGGTGTIGIAGGDPTDNFSTSGTDFTTL